MHFLRLPTKINILHDYIINSEIVTKFKHAIKIESIFFTLINFLYFSFDKFRGNILVCHSLRQLQSSYNVIIYIICIGYKLVSLQSPQLLAYISNLKIVIYV